ncbi:DegQ family serine endoprotease [Terrirubrum flagellatum]|uniref:DegQ family serine endoprotease n=1 Tax=Terrirubrum flagellatum TaxID=2895980 RepID=UPI003CC829E1
MRIVRVIVMTGALLVGAGGAVEAQQPRAVPESRQQITLSFAPVAQRTSNSVVNVYGTSRQQLPQNPFANDELFKRFFGGDGGMPRERVQQSLGSGVVVDASGLVVTNHHVIENMTEVKVSLPDKREYEATIVLRDPRTDLAVLKLKGAEHLSPIEIGDSDALQVGDLVLAIGNPFGVGQTVTQGIVSALARTQIGVSDYQFFIQTDAAINPGNSGGALVDMAGRLIGINTAIYSRSGGSMGIGFAIPAAMVKVVVESAKTGGKSVRRPWFGASLQQVSNDVAEAMGLDRASGALVSRVFEPGPAADAGLKRSDLILAVDGQPIDSPDAFGFRFATKSIGATVSLKVRRAGKELIVPVKTAAAPETPARDARKLGGPTPFSGATVANLSPAVAEEMSMDVSSTGVVVTEIDPGTTAGQIGFQKGDIILAVNNQKIENSRDLDKLGRERFWRITVNRGGQVFTSVFGG